MDHVRVTWDRFRCDINRDYIKPHNRDVVAIRANVLDEYSQKDWDYILDHRFLKDDFKVNLLIINIIHAFVYNKLY